MLDSSSSSNRTLLFRSLTATGSGIAAKVVGLINQIVSITLITNALGAEGLEAQIPAIASVSWFSLTFLGMYTSQEYLSWKPTTPLREGLVRAIAYFEQILTQDGVKALATA